MNAIVETITPNLAAKYIDEANPANRPISQRHVRGFAEEMRAGRWKLTGEPIIFNGTGKLLDGHHRLWAVLEAETPVQMLVVRGADSSAVDCIDTGRARGAGNVMHMAGINGGTQMGAIVRNYIQWFTPSMEVVPISAIMATYREKASEFENARNFGMKVVKAVGGGASVCVGFLLSARRDWAEAETFAESTASGANLKVDDPRLALRKYCFARQGHDHGDPDRRRLVAAYLKAFEAYRRGSPITLLKVSPGEVVQQQKLCSVPT